ncbi:hypothetical protein I3843_03G135300 [Carya illinoinensis]|nr:hypothetical protein I3843_03G135300 [Carya illinoinensis]
MHYPPGPIAPTIFHKRLSLSLSLSLSVIGSHSLFSSLCFTDVLPTAVAAIFLPPSISLPPPSATTLHGLQPHATLVLRCKDLSNLHALFLFAKSSHHQLFLDLNIYTT